MEVTGVKCEKCTHPSAAAGAEESYWWCDVCSQRVEERQVTYHEYHDGCGGKVREVTTHSPVLPVVTEADENGDVRISVSVGPVTVDEAVACLRRHGWTIDTAALTAELPEQPVPPVVTEDARDAARYRFWRDKACNQPSLIARNLTSCLYTHEIDETIDRLMDAAREVQPS